MSETTARKQAEALLGSLVTFRPNLTPRLQAALQEAERAGMRKAAAFCRERVAINDEKARALDRYGATREQRTIYQERAQEAEDLAECLERMAGNE